MILLLGKTFYRFVIYSIKKNDVAFSCLQEEIIVLNFHYI